MTKSENGSQYKPGNVQEGLSQFPEWIYYTGFNVNYEFWEEIVRLMVTVDGNSCGRFEKPGVEN
jgi:hypothetical protein